MIVKTLTAAAAAVLMLAAACGSDTEDTEADAAAVDEEEEFDLDAQADDEAEGDGGAEPLEWGESATVTGESGTDVHLSPAAIRYIGAEDMPGITREEMIPDGVFAVVQFDAEAIEGEESLSWASGAGFTWRLDGQQLDREDSGDPPWTGLVDGFYGEPILPDEGSREGLVWFDVPEAGEGHLSYADPAGPLVRWEVPTEPEGDEGPVWDQVDSAIAEYSEV